MWTIFCIWKDWGFTCTIIVVNLIYFHCLAFIELCNNQASTSRCNGSIADKLWQDILIFEVICINSQRAHSDVIFGQSEHSAQLNILVYCTSDVIPTLPFANCTALNIHPTLSADSDVTAFCIDNSCLFCQYSVWPTLRQIFNNPSLQHLFTTLFYCFINFYWKLRVLKWHFGIIISLSLILLYIIVHHCLSK